MMKDEFDKARKPSHSWPGVSVAEGLELLHSKEVLGSIPGCAGSPRPAQRVRLVQVGGSG